MRRLRAVLLFAISAVVIIVCAGATALAIVVNTL